MILKHLKTAIQSAQKCPTKYTEVKEALAKKPRSIVILDDDPTGTQTVHDVPVVTQWAEDVLEWELLNSPVFFILTNSRSMVPKKAEDLGKSIGKLLYKLAKKHNKNLLVISRSDSTLRGHYPNEVNALARGLNLHNPKHLIVPAFFEGGRYTYNDMHYVQEENTLVPVGETPFAQDSAFGFSSSNLKDWILEKGNGTIMPDTIKSISVHDLEEGGHIKAKAVLNSNSTYFVVNATHISHLQTIALACLDCDYPILYRTAASFINAIAAIEPRECLQKRDIITTAENGANLTLIGSYVPKTTEQLNVLKENYDATFLELNVANAMQPSLFQKELEHITYQVDTAIAKGRNVVVYTSRKMLMGTSKTQNLEIINSVSKGLLTIVNSLKHRPKCILAKGGITSSDIATKGLGAQRAMVLGQIQKGIPVWKLGRNAKFPGLKYIVFPGNVGNKNTLFEVLKQLE
ncbi:four-carbon acid sugar kinase family protein [uncultured Croceitalea sp.]|uniref:four-carbon acid sugar kinase family protein n=1 Tax=uncultured Croceitalea sp. TaxID=1798908 RepID=UPI00374E29F6